VGLVKEDTENPNQLLFAPRWDLRNLGRCALGRIVGAELIRLVSCKEHTHPLVALTLKSRKGQKPKCSSRWLVHPGMQYHGTRFMFSDNLRSNHRLLQLSTFHSSVQLFREQRAADNSRTRHQKSSPFLKALQLRRTTVKWLIMAAIHVQNMAWVGARSSITATGLLTRRATSVARPAQLRIEKVRARKNSTERSCIKLS
jgi:hypothetical protein